MSRLRTWRCRVTAESPRSRRPAKSEINACTGLILGYAQTLTLLLYFDLDSNDVKSAQHARYDEGMNDVADHLPNARLLPFAHEPFLPRSHFLNVRRSMCLIILFKISAFCPCSLQMSLVSVTVVVSSSAPTLCQPRVALFFTVEKALSPTFDAIAAGDLSTPKSRSTTVDFLCLLLQFRRSPIKRIHALRTVPGEGGFCVYRCYACGGIH
jgi:hypothetical protein